MSMKSSRLGCSGVKPGWIISALLVYAEEEESIISDMRAREVCVSASACVSVLFVLWDISLFVGWVPSADFLTHVTISHTKGQNCGSGKKH